MACNVAPLGVPVVAHPIGVPCWVTANRSVPLPVRPSVLVTSMSNPLITASLAIVIFAVKLVEPLNAVELTVTPPGFVVPVTNHWALAPLLNPLPLSVTFKLVVPWGAAAGLVEVTWIWAAAGRMPTTATKTARVSNIDE